MFRLLVSLGTVTKLFEANTGPWFEAWLQVAAIQLKDRKGRSAALDSATAVSSSNKELWFKLMGTSMPTCTCMPTHMYNVAVY